MSEQLRQSGSTEGYQSEAERRLGSLPNFFRLGPEGSDISENMWGAAKFGYFDNPLPSLLKERLFVYLSRFCEVRYCIARHVGFLVGMGNPSGDTDCAAETVEHVIDLIRRPLPKESELDARIDLLETFEGSLLKLPDPRTPEEDAFFSCASHVFLQTPHASRCLKALQSSLDELSLQHLLVFLSFVRMAHFWTVVHPELKLEDDIVELLSVQEALAECVLNDLEGTVQEESKALKEELAALKKERKQTRLLETTLASIGDAVIATDIEGRVTIMNAEAQSLTGWKAKHALGKPLNKVFCTVNEETNEPLENPRVKTKAEAATKVARFQTLLVAKDGTNCPIDENVSTIRDERGEESGYVLVFRDATERRKQERAVAERAELAVFGRDIGLALTGESNLTSMLRVCSEVMVTRLNGAVARIWILNEKSGTLELFASAGIDTDLGGDHSRIPIGKFKIGLIAKERKPHLTNSLIDDPLVLNQDWVREEGLVAFAGYPLLIDDRVLGVMGTYARHKLSTAALDAMESVASGIALGIERLRSEERIRESELRYRLVGQAANDAIWDWDLLTRQVTWNEGVLTRFGYEVNQVDSDAAWWLDRIHPDDKERVESGIHELIESGEESWSEEYRFRRADGTYASVLDRGRVVHDARNLPVRMVGSMFDLTERKRNEKRQAFLAELASTTQPLVNPDEVTIVTARLLTEYLEVDRCVYAEIEDKDVLVINGDHSVSVPNISGRRPLAAFGQEYVRAMLSNDAFVVYDSETDERIGPEALEAFRALNIRAAIFVPLHKDGIFTATMGVHQTVERSWTPEEMELMRLVAGRCWESLERARTSRRLRESEERVRMAVQSANIGTWDFEIESDTLRWSERCKEVFGLAHDADINYKIFLSHIHPDDRDHVDATVQSALDPNGSGGYKIDYRAVWPDGTVRWIVASGEAFFSGEGNAKRAVRFVGTVLDITERKEAEEQLRASERFNRTILESSPDSINILDAVGRLQMMNRHAMRLMEIDDLSEVENHELASIWPEEGRDRLREAIVAARSGQTDRFQVQYPTGSGEKRWWDVVLAPVSDDAGVASQLIAVTRDITLQKSAEEQLREVAARLSEEDRRKDEFLATLAHELRNPLAPIRSGLEVMKVAKDDPTMFEDVRGMMERQTKQLIVLIDDLLDVSRITQGKLELRKSRVELGSVVASAVETSRPLIDEAKHNLIIAIPDSPISLNADPNRLAQVISNLLNNAAKYTPNGGEIHLSVELEVDEVVVIVRDNGIGIRTEMREYIFEMFAQVGRSLERAYTGLGIGLTLVKSLVEMHKGRIDVRSDGEGKGSSFYVYLPFRKEEKSERPKISDTAIDETTGVKCRVLVVDDNESAAKMLSLVVKMLGYEVKTAHDGEEAIAVAAEYLPEVILMDLGMPRMTGYEAARHIRGQAWGEGIFLIALTGWGQQEDRRRTAEAGFDRHLVKPSDPDELKKVLAEVDSRRRV